MFNVRVRFETKELNTVTRFRGYCKSLPKIGLDFTVFEQKRANKIDIIRLGQVYNIKDCGQLLIVQTALYVAEVWLTDPRKEQTGSAVVLPFKRPETKKGPKLGLVSSGNFNVASSD